MIVIVITIIFILVGINIKKQGNFMMPITSLLDNSPIDISDKSLVIGSIHIDRALRCLRQTHYWYALKNTEFTECVYVPMFNHTMPGNDSSFHKFKDFCKISLEVLRFFQNQLNLMILLLWFFILGLTVLVFSYY